jgi:hypothetical protein
MPETPHEAVKREQDECTGGLTDVVTSVTI